MEPLLLKQVDVELFEIIPQLLILQDNNIEYYTTTLRLVPS